MISKLDMLSDWVYGLRGEGVKGNTEGFCLSTEKE
jgi:hypothetical protein